MRIGAGALVCALLVSCGAASAQARPQAVIAFLPNGPGETRPLIEELAARGMAIGMTSPTVGGFDPRQMALDTSQGARIPSRLYSGDIGPLRLRNGRLTGWARTLRRAADAPGDLRPGLLASTIERAGGRVGYRGPPGFSPAAVVASDRGGGVTPLQPGDTLDVWQLAPGAAGLRQLDRLLAARGPDGFVYVVRAPYGTKLRLLPSGVAAPGVRGQLWSATTRRKGLVAATDVAPSVLRALGIAVPDAMQGEPIEGRGTADPTAVEDMAKRLAVVTARRAGALLWLLGAWLVLLLVLWWRGGDRGVRAALRAGLLTALWVPGVALLTAALEPSQIVETAVIGAGSVALGVLTDRVVRWPLAPSVPAAIVFAAHAIDLAHGSPLTGASLAGPNPAGGARFYGIGNELEAMLSLSVLIGAGAALAAWAAGVCYAADPGGAVARHAADPGARAPGARSEPGARAAPARRVPIAFAAVVIVAAAIMGAGRLGADVGAVITLAAGGAAAVIASVTTTPSRRAVALGVAAPVGAIGALGAIACLAARRRRYLDGLPAPLAAGLIGAWFAAVAGAVANDSGPLILVIGAIFLLLAAGYARSRPRTAMRRL